ncbi:MAG TPA: hypothetical protein GX528_04475 [Firmicutes bacterium]|nr:hypothetical protein [Bacillota bacterium]
MNRKMLGLAILVVLLFSFTAGASSFQADATYVFGQGELGGVATENRGFLVAAQARIFPQILADGLFLSLNPVELDGEEVAGGSNFSESIMAGGAKFVVSADADLDIYLGGGWLSHKVNYGEEFKGGGIYGKFGFDFQLHPQVNLAGDLSYAPKFKYEEEGENTFLAGRVSVSYEVYNDLGIQGTLLHTSGKIGEQKSSGLIYGGGLVIRF